MANKKADDIQVGGDHYKKCPPEFQHWSLVTIHGWDYFQAQIIKYVMRFREKGGVTDLKKAQHFLSKLIELEEAKGEVQVTTPSPPLPWKEPTYEAVEEKASYQGLPNTADGVQEPRSSYDFTYEGGTSKLDMYRCKKCRKHFEIPLGSMPGMYHFCPSDAVEPISGYVDQ